MIVIIRPRYLRQNEQQLSSLSPYVAHMVRLDMELLGYFLVFLTQISIE